MSQDESDHIEERRQQLAEAEREAREASPPPGPRSKAFNEEHPPESVVSH